MKVETRQHLLLILGVILLSFTAEKCRQLVGGEASSKSWTERFTFWNRFDMSYGTIAWITKELLKAYLFYIRAVHVQRIRTEATKAAITEYIEQDQNLDIMAAKEKGKAAAKQAYRQLKHVTAPALSSLWDVFETLYVGGSFAEGVTRGIGTFLGAYAGGIYGEGKLNWIGFLVGSQLGSLAGSRIGLMIYDIGKGIQFCILLIFGQRNYYPSTYKEL
ncbi:hypothetical protein DCAR_0520929 [Daucus carota subsp. sativus]|uniref:Glycine zipper 2TM domain-containing protein n=1 Tax=Daucus carota subsp. sativus TaxID=79200 RepID=A0AAF0X4Y4_DAUCS|nr:PREDICTED: uncharacterized protein LOC108222733 [Daucus carota subsp. sativus]WOH01545.1 hypothetical protein DCAR_0520929 [Daucus carota subsp. sativus]